MSRYHKKITPDADGLIDLYAIAEAYAVKSNPQFHAMKKIMMAGERGHKSLVQDIDEAIIAAQRWKEMVSQDLVRPPMQFNCPPLCSKCHTLHHVTESCSARALLDAVRALQECPRCLGRFPADQPCPTCARHEKTAHVADALRECPACGSRYPTGQHCPTKGCPA